MNQSNSHTSAEAGELAKFESLAQQWWDPEGPLKTLHDINPLRLEYIDQRAALAGARVLDVGCGGGILSEAMALEGAEVLGIDLAQASLDAAVAHARETGVELQYRCVDIEQLADEQPGSFDVVTCLELLEHVPDPASVVTACARLARPGGAVFFSTINRNLKSFLMAIVGAEHILRMVPRGTHEYEKLIRPSELAAWGRGADLALLDVTGLHFNPLTQTYSLGGNADVNYLAHTRRGGAV